MTTHSEIGHKENIHNLQEFAKSAALLSSRQPRLIEKYPSQWIGVYRENVEGNAERLDELIELLKEKQIPLGDTIIRFICEDQQTLIL